MVGARASLEAVQFYALNSENKQILETSDCVDVKQFSRTTSLIWECHSQSTIDIKTNGDKQIKTVLLRYERAQVRFLYGVGLCEPIWIRANLYIARGDRERTFSNEIENQNKLNKKKRKIRAQWTKIILCVQIGAEIYTLTVDWIEWVTWFDSIGSVKFSVIQLCFGKMFIFVVRRAYQIQ